MQEFVKVAVNTVGKVLEMSVLLALVGIKTSSFIYAMHKMFKPDSG